MISSQTYYVWLESELCLVTNEEDCWNDRNFSYSIVCTFITAHFNVVSRLLINSGQVVTTKALTDDNSCLFVEFSLTAGDSRNAIPYHT